MYTFCSLYMRISIVKITALSYRTCKKKQQQTPTYIYNATLYEQKRFIISGRFRGRWPLEGCRRIGSPRPYLPLFLLRHTIYRLSDLLRNWLRHFPGQRIFGLALHILSCYTCQSRYINDIYWHVKMIDMRLLMENVRFWKRSKIVRLFQLWQKCISLTNNNNDYT